jgi:hypothetical protein
MYVFAHPRVFTSKSVDTSVVGTRTKMLVSTKRNPQVGQCKHLSFDEVCKLLEQRIEIMRELERHWRELLEKEVDLVKEVCGE